MGFNFPNTPTSGQTYTPAGGPTFAWDGVAWKSLTSGVPVTVYVNDTPPVSPAPGQLYWESDTGNLYIWYSDGDSAQWVQVNGTPGGYQTAQTRNRIVNGAMQISQEVGKEAGVPLTGFPADQWAISCSTAATGAMGVCTASPASKDSIWRVQLFSGATPDTSIAAGDIARIMQDIEGTRIADFMWGTANAKQVILRFTAHSSMTGTFCVAIRNGAANNRSYIKNCTITAANTDQEFTIVIPGDTTGSWVTTTAAAWQVHFAVVAGSSYYGVEGWQAGSFIATSAISNFFGTANTSFFLSKVGLYLDPLNTGVAPPWTMPDEAEELAACQRYWRRVMITLDAYSLTAGCASQGILLSPDARIAPAVALEAPFVGPNNMSTPVLQGGSTSTPYNISVNGYHLATGRAYYYGNAILSARM